jgi:hypothetical protein
MGIFFILAGLVSIGYYFYGTSKQSPHPPLSKFIYIGCAGFCLICTLYLSYNVAEIWVEDKYRSIWYLACSGFALVGLFTFGKAAYEADAKAAADMEARAKAKESELSGKKSELDLDYAKRRAEAQQIFEAALLQTQIAEQQTKQTEFDVITSLAPAAKQEGLDIEGVIAVNTHHNIKKIDAKIAKKEKKLDHKLRKEEKEFELQTEAEKIKQQLDAADRVEYRRIIKELREDLDDLIIKRRNIEVNETDEILKAQRIALLDKQIEQTQEDIDDRQKNRLLSSSDGKETKRLT